jgi:hypothetical protein
MQGPMNVKFNYIIGIYSVTFVRCGVISAPNHCFLKASWGVEETLCVCVCVYISLMSSHVGRW